MSIYINVHIDIVWSEAKIRCAFRAAWRTETTITLNVARTYFWLATTIAHILGDLKANLQNFYTFDISMPSGSLRLYNKTHYMMSESEFTSLCFLDMLSLDVVFSIDTLWNTITYLVTQLFQKLCMKTHGFSTKRLSINYTSAWFTLYIVTCPKVAHVVATFKHAYGDRLT